MIKRIFDVVIQTVLDQIPIIGPFLKNIDQQQEKITQQDINKHFEDNISLYRRTVDVKYNVHTTFQNNPTPFETLSEYLKQSPHIQPSNWNNVEQILSEDEIHNLIDCGAKFTDHIAIGQIGKYLKIPEEQYELGMLCCCGNIKQVEKLKQHIGEALTLNEPHILKLLCGNALRVRPYIKAYIKQTLPNILITNEIIGNKFSENEFTVVK